MKNSYRGLVIDDSQTMFKILVKRLADTGIDIVDYAPDGESGIKIACAKKFDLITMDIDMPGIDGFEAAEEILNLHPNQKILFISSKYDECVREAKLIGFHHFLPKPFTIESLITEIKLIQMLQ